MNHVTRTTPGRNAGDSWLADCTGRPDLAHEVWGKNSLLPILSTEWRVAEAHLQPALQAVQRIPEHEQGPILMDIRLDRAWWLVPLDADEQLADVSGVSVQPIGWPLHCPPASRCIGSRVWLDAPDGTGRLMNPAYLAAALGPGGGPRLPAEAFG